MSPDPLIHLGYQKTASTFLQKLVFSNEEVFYAPWGPQSAQAIDTFVLEHPRRFTPEKIRSSLIDPDGRVPIISHEDLLGYPAYGRYYAGPTIRRIFESLPNSRLLICVREQEAILLSNYFQYIRQGGTRNLHQMLVGAGARVGFRPMFRLDHFEYDLTYSLIREHFTKDRIMFLPVELLRSNQERFMTLLSDFMGIDYHWRINAPKIINRRSSSIALISERLLNKVFRNPHTLPEKYSDYPFRVRGRNRVVRTISKITAGRKVDDHYLNKMKTEISFHVKDYFRESNDRLSNITGIDFSDFGYKL